MAITNAQQFKQLVNPPMDGKRPGYRGDAAYGKDSRSEQATSIGQAQGATGKGGGQSLGDGPKTGAPSQDRIAEIRQANITLENLRQDKIEEKLEKFRKLGSKTRQFQNYLKKFSPISMFASQFGPLNTRDFFTDKVLGSKNFANMTKEQFANLTNEEQEELFDSYMDARMSGETDAYGNTINTGNDGGQQVLPIIPQTISDMTSDASDVDTEKEDMSRMFRLMADGGRVKFFKGAQADASAGKGAMSPGTDTGGGFRGGGDDGPKGPPADVLEKIGGGGGGGITTLESKKNIPTTNTDFMKFSTKDLIDMGLLDDDEQDTMKVAGLNQEQVDYLNKVGKKVLGVSPEGGDFFSYDSPANVKSQLEKLNPESESGIFSKEFDPDEIVAGDPNTYATEKDVQDYIKKTFPNLNTGGRKVGLADGGIMNSDVIGGEFDFESARQMYGLGKLVKKATRAVKKIVKSPIGKAALFAGLGAYGLGAGPFSSGKFGAGFLKNPKFLEFMFKGGEPGLFNLTGKGAMAGIAALSAAPLLFGQQQEEDDEEEQYRGPGLDIANIRANPYTFIPRRFAAEGGSMKEPVAKKTMPLIDMDGQEKDYRETGGFVDMGRMERADDVPARLSKNEFVFTADAVRNAGDGSVDKGAEVMYNMMKNLESGGDVSEESQGLEGARKMFQTSQRLEEVL